MYMNGYFPFLINKLDTIERGIIMLIKSAVTRSRLPDVGFGETQHSR